MHPSDFRLIETAENEFGTCYIVEIPAAQKIVRYQHHRDQGTYQLVPKGSKIVIAGHDMTSIIGKRFREWIVQHLTEKRNPPGENHP